ncbi:cytochrome P450 CYP12A2-like isoform X2 [Arctopsyche grandis]|uniref:cytochrome P450 CYP12A2-like isoform X2 n=1 Tax=Arctopsyche grandis TaxID=121162 RepID=UPI00406D94F5
MNRSVNNMFLLVQGRSVLSMTQARFLGTCTINRQLENMSEECPAHAAKPKKDFSDYHCSKEEWDNAKPFSQIPGPVPLPIIGNTWRFLPKIGEYGNMANDITKMFDRLHSDFGEIVKMEKVLGRKTAIHLFDPNDIEKIYKAEGVFPERMLLPSMLYFRKNMRQEIFKHTKGLLTSDGEDWYTFRNKVNTIMMQPKMIKQYVEPVDSIAKEFVTRIQSIRGKDNKLSIDFMTEINKWSLESITYLALNTKLGCLQGELSDDSTPAKMIKITEEVFIYLGKLDVEPNLSKFFATPTFKKAMKAYDDQVSFSQGLIQKAVERIEAKNIGDMSDSEPSVLEKLLKVDKNVAIVMALDMLLAGIDTTSTALMNIFYYLAINQSKQDILRKEIMTLLPDNNSKLTADILNSLPYMKACIKEAARLYPVTAGTMRILTKGTVLKGYQLPKGTDVIFLHMAISISEKHFPRPQEFIPERWLRENIDSDISYKKAHPFCTMHFGFGARSCVGRRFAELELEVALINFMRYFKLKWEGPPPKRGITTINYLKPPFNFTFENVK